MLKTNLDYSKQIFLITCIMASYLIIGMIRKNILSVNIINDLFQSGSSFTWVLIGEEVENCSKTDRLKIRISDASYRLRLLYYLACNGNESENIISNGTKYGNWDQISRFLLGYHYYENENSELAEYLWRRIGANRYFNLLAQKSKKLGLNQNELLELSVSIDHDNPQTNYLYGDYYWSMDLKNEAKFYYRKAIQNDLNKNSINYYRSSGRIEYIKSNWIQAINNFKVAGKMGDVSSKFDISRTLYYGMMRKNEAMIHLVKMINEHPDYKWSYLLLSEIYTDNGYYSLARKIIDQTLANFPKDHIIYVYRGRIEIEAGNCDKGIHYLELSNSIKPNIDAYSYLAKCARLNNNPEKTITYLREANEIFPNSWVIKTQLINVYMQNDMHDMGVALLCEEHKHNGNGSEIESISESLYPDKDIDDICSNN